MTKEESKFSAFKKKRFFYSAIAHAIPHPSYVDVPRPNSSITTNDFAVAVYKTNIFLSIEKKKEKEKLRKNSSRE